MQRFTLLLPLFFSCAGASHQDPTEAPDSALSAVTAFRDARKRGDFAAARALLADDPRIWYDEKEGEGAPWKLAAGRWSDWDEHFRGESNVVGEWHVEGRIGGARVWADVAETNDYFRLTEASGSRWRGTYYLDAAGRIAGFMVSGVPGWKSDRGRRDAFQVWAREQRPDEAEYLMPGGSIDPTGDRPERMRALLEAWRRESGLPPVPEAMP